MVRAMTEGEIMSKFGVKPTHIGIRYRGHCIVAMIEEEEQSAGAQVGDLCVRTRDGGSNPIDMGTLKIENCIGTAQDEEDHTYRYYYFRERSLRPIMEQKREPE